MLAGCEAWAGYARSLSLSLLICEMGHTHGLYFTDVQTQLQRSDLPEYPQTRVFRIYKYIKKIFGVPVWLSQWSLPLLILGL